jgi:hypothetical protein
MSGFVDEFMKSMGGYVASQAASSLGINQKTVQQMIPALVPMILGGLRRQKDEQGGAARVDHILNKYGKSDVLNDIGGLFASKVTQSNPDPNLGGLLGNSGSQAVDMLANNFKLDPSVITKFIPMLAPLVLGYLTKKRDSGMGSSGITSILDSDGDGSILDDVAGFLTQNLGSSKGGGLLGGLLGGLFGKKNP